MAALWLSLVLALLGLAGLYLLLRPVRRPKPRTVAREGRFATLTNTPVTSDPAPERKETGPPSG